jgi:IclR family transcriptional regulator, KDG regulon repressor
MAEERATSVRRAFDLLFALGTDEATAAGGLGVVRLAELVGSEKTRVSRTLRTLDEYRLVERDASTQAYRLGSALFSLAALYGPRRLRASAPPFLRRLVVEQDERAHLSVLDGALVLTILSEAPTHALQAAGWVGRSVDAHSTASGRALLLDHDLDALARRFPEPFPPAGPNAPRDVAELSARLGVDRDRGYAVAVDESEVGLVAVAAPLRDFTGTIVAAVNVSGPGFRLADRLESCGSSVRATAVDLSAQLGHRPGQP